MIEHRKIPCYCDTEVEIDVPDEVELSEDPDLERSILEGRFLSATCPKCGKVLKPEFSLRVLDRSSGLELVLVPELERGSFMLGTSAYAPRDRANGRVVIGFPELVEKLLIRRAGLDDRVVEVIKYYVSQKSGAEPNVRIYFKEKSGAALILHIFGLRKDEVGVTKIPLTLYERVASELPQKSTEEPFDLILQPPYVSYQKVAIEVTE